MKATGSTTLNRRPEQAGDSLSANSGVVVDFRFDGDLPPIHNMLEAGEDGSIAIILVVLLVAEML